jgi:hypothetical protein
MLALYVMCLIFGGVLLALSIFAGGDMDVDTDFDVDASAEVDGDLDAAGEGVGAAARFLSFRDLVFFAAFFGLAGTLFTTLDVNFLVTLVTSVGVGLVAAVIVHHLMGYLRNSESGALVSLRNLEGALAQVVIDIGESKPGKIAIKEGDRTHQLIARRHDEAKSERFRTSDTVVVVRVENGIAYVAETTFLT